jgi:hypothetical protein
MESEFEIPPLTKCGYHTHTHARKQTRCKRILFAHETDMNPLEPDMHPLEAALFPYLGIKHRRNGFLFFCVWAICWFGLFVWLLVASEHIVKKLSVSIVLSLRKALNDHCQQASVSVFISFVLLGAASRCQQTILCVACVCFGFVGVVGTNVVVVTVVGSIPVDKPFGQDE